MNHLLNRRDFLRRGLILVSAGVAAPAFLAKTGLLTPLPAAAQTRAGRGILVVVQLSGGNDGLNTVIPYADPLYRQLRTQGTPIPTNDLWIAALVVEHDVALLTGDAHFRKLPQLDLI